MSLVETTSFAHLNACIRYTVQRSPDIDNVGWLALTIP